MKHGRKRYYCYWEAIWPTTVPNPSAQGTVHKPRSVAASSTLIGQRACSRVGWDESWTQCAAPRRWASTKLTIRQEPTTGDRKSTRLNSSHGYISYAVFCLKKKKLCVTSSR